MKILHSTAAALATLTAFGVLVACSPDQENTPSTGDSDTCGFAFVMQDPTSGSTSQQTIERGLNRASDELDVQIDIIDGTGLAAVADTLRSVAATGCYQAIGTAFFANGESVTQVAAEYPDQAFYIAGGVAEGPNVTSFDAANEEGTYVAGAMAAAMTESGTIGVVIGDDSPSLRRYSDGFAAGATSVDPDISVITTAVGSFTDPAKAGSIATHQASEGADIIYSAAGSNLQVYALGSENGYRTVASDLTDWVNVKDTEPSLAFIAAASEDNLAYTIIAEYIDGAVPGGEVRDLGLADGIFTIPYITDPASEEYNLPRDVIDAGNTAYEFILDGGSATN